MALLATKLFTLLLELLLSSGEIEILVVETPVSSVVVCCTVVVFRVVFASVVVAFSMVVVSLSVVVVVSGALPLRTEYAPRTTNAKTATNTTAKIITSLPLILKT